MKREKSILIIQNNSSAIQPVNLFTTNPNQAGGINGVNYQWDISSLVIFQLINVQLQVGMAGTALTTITAPITANSLQGILDALNSLNVSFFYAVTTGASTFIRTSNRIFVFGTLKINQGMNPAALQFYFVVGGPNNFSSIPGAPAVPTAGALSMTSSLLAGVRCRMTRSGQDLLGIDPGNGDAFFTKATNIGTITWSPALATGEEIIIETMPPNATQFYWVAGGVSNFASIPGAPSSSPAAGSVSMTTGLLTGLQSRMSRGGQSQLGINPANGDTYFTKNQASSIINWNPALASQEELLVETIPLPIVQFYWVVGGVNNFATIPGAPPVPMAGDLSMTTSLLAGTNCRVSRGSLNQMGINPLNGNSFFTKAQQQGIITWSPALAAQEEMLIEVIPV